MGARRGWVGASKREAGSEHAKGVRCVYRRRHPYCTQVAAVAFGAAATKLSSLGSAPLGFSPAAAAPNMNGDYILTRGPQAGDTKAKFPTHFAD